MSTSICDCRCCKTGYTCCNFFRYIVTFQDFLTMTMQVSSARLGTGSLVQESLGVLAAPHLRTKHFPLCAAAICRRLLFYDRRQHLFLYKVNPVKNPRFECTRYSDRCVYLFVNIDNIAAVTDCGIHFSVIKRPVP